jgi:tRNA (cytidine/uridine-2'-O-)-methyltransferase
MRLALHQPDQAGNVGAILRLAACLDVPVDIVEPCGFPWSDRALKRAGMDYAGIAAVTRHASWEDFEAVIQGRLVLLTTSGDVRLDEARFDVDDVLLLGSESRGVPPDVHSRAALRVRIPQVAATRSLNLAVAAGIALAEALRQCKAWPGELGRTPMDGQSRFERRRMDGAEFQNVSLAGAVFDDVNLGGARFTNINLSGARFEDVNLSNVAIDNANIKGLSIFGYDIEALIEAQLDRDCRDEG